MRDSQAYTAVTLVGVEPGKLQFKPQERSLHIYLPEDGDMVLINIPEEYMDDIIEAAREVKGR
jgi:predicted metal-dependent hydrolase